MGSFLSTPKKLNAKVHVPKKRNSSALRHRISPNKETLDRVLRRIGHPVREASRVSHRWVRQTWRQSRVPQAPAFNGWNLLKDLKNFEASDTQVDRNKPLPLLPSLPTAAQHNEPQRLEPLHPPPPPSVGTSGTNGASRLEEELERSFIERQRQETLRQLESKPVPALTSRVPAIILQRIEKGAMLWGSLGSRAARRRQGSSGML